MLHRIKHIIIDGVVKLFLKIVQFRKCFKIILLKMTDFLTNKTFLIYFINDYMSLINSKINYKKSYTLRVAPQTASSCNPFGGEF